MPVLKDFRQTTEITLPSFPDSKVVLYDSLLIGDLIGATDKNPLFAWTKLIKEWNFTDEAGKPLPITVENLALLKNADFEVLAAATKAFGEAVKKD